MPDSQHFFLKKEEREDTIIVLIMKKSFILKRTNEHVFEQSLHMALVIDYRKVVVLKSARVRTVYFIIQKLNL